MRAFPSTWRLPRRRIAVPETDPVADELFRDARVARLATASPDGRPHVVPITFAWLSGRIYTPIDRKPKRVDDPRRLRRVRNLVANPRAAVVVDRWDEDWSRLAYVIAEGPAAILDSGAEWERAAAALAARYPQYARLPLEGRPIIRIQVERLIAWRAARAR